MPGRGAPTRLDDILVRGADIASAVVGWAALAVAPRFERLVTLLALLARVAETGDLTTLRQAHDRLPQASTVLAPAGAAVTAALTASYRRLADTAPDAYLPDLAASLNNLAVRLADVAAGSRPWPRPGKPWIFAAGSPRPRRRCTRRILRHDREFVT